MNADLIARLLAWLVPLAPFGLYLERAWWLDPPVHANCRCVVVPLWSRRV